MAVNTTDLVLAPHPLTTDGQQVHAGLVLDPNETLATLLARHEVVAGEGWEVRISGAVVPVLLWQRTRVRHGQVIEVRQRAGKDIARVAAIVVLAYVTMQLGLPAAYLGLQGFAAFAVNVGAFIVGSALVNRLLPASRAQLGTYQSQSGTTYSLSGARNRARHYEPLGLLLGTVRVTPDLAAQPYAWFAGDEQYQYLVFHAGINCADVEQLKVGDTLLSSYDGVDVARAGFPGETTGLQQWASVDTVAGGLLAATTSPGDWVTRTTSVGTVHLALDVAAQLYRMDDNGNVQNQTLRLAAEYRALPSGSWQPLISATALATQAVFGWVARDAVPGDPSAFDVAHGATKLHRGTFDLSVPAGQYEVRMRKISADSTDTRTQNTVEWVSLKSYQPDPANYSGQPRVGVRIRASGQLNGSLDTLNWIGHSAPCPLWTGSAWTTVATSNPGALFLLVARGIYAPSGRLLAGLGLADAQIDITGLQAFMVHCATRGYTFNHWFDAAMSCGDMLDAIAAAGLGVKSYHSGRLGVVWLDESQPITGVVGPVRMAARSFSVEYATGDLADEVEVSWPDSESGTWLSKSVRVMAPDVTGTPRSTARQAPIGVDTQAGALLVARLAMAQNIWQRKAISWQMDLEHLDFHRYSVVALSHDLTQWGSSGRLVAAIDVAGTVTLHLDDDVAAGSAGRYIGLQLPNEQGYRVFTVAAFAGTSRSVTLVEAWPAGVALPGSSAANPAHDTVWIYDFTATPGKRLLVTGVEPAADMKGARVTAVPLPDEFWTFVRSGAFTALPAPAAAQPVVVTNIRVLQQRLDVTYDDTTDLAITWDATGPYDHAQVFGSRVGEALVLLGEARSTRWPSWRVRNDGTYRIQVRPFDALGRAGQLSSTTHTVTLSAFETGARTYRQEAAPGAPRAGDLWTKPSTGEQRRWSGTAWELVSTVGANASNFTGQIGGGNLVGNSGFLAHDGAVPTGWGVYNNAGVLVTTQVLVGGLFGSNFMRFTVGGSVPSTCGLYVRNNAEQVMSWVPGQTYVVSCWVRAANSGAVGKKVWPLYSNMGFVSEYEIESPTMVEGTWRRVAVRCSPNNSADFTYAGELFISAVSGTLPAGAAYDICAVQVELGEIPTTWSASNRDAGLTSGLQLVTRYGVTRQGDILTKTGGSSGWNADAYSVDSYKGGAYAIASPQQTNMNVIFGLNSDPTSSAWWEDLDYAWYFADDGVCHVIYDSPGGKVWVNRGSYATGASWAVTYDGSKVRWLRNGNIEHEIERADTNNLYFDSSFYNIGASLAGCRFGPLTSNNWAAVGGANKPADNATKNAVTYSPTAPSSPTDGDLWCDTSVTPRVWRVRLGGTWQAAASYVTDTAQISDGAQLGLTAVWTGVTGTGKPADGATVNRLTYSATVPSSPVDGDIWVDTSANPATVKMRTGGSWVSGANLTTNTNQLTDGASLGQTAVWDQVSGSGKPANDATRNAVTYSHSTPSSPTDGDLWCDTSVTPRVWRVRLGGVWQAAASYVTDTAQISDGAQLGLTAVWTGVTGAGKPADGATVNRLTYSASAPGSPVDGDIWVDTSASPATIKLRTSGAWVSGANLSTGALAQLHSVGTSQIDPGAATTVYVATATGVAVHGMSGVPVYGTWTNVVSVTFTAAANSYVVMTVTGAVAVSTPASGFMLDLASMNSIFTVNGDFLDDDRVSEFYERIGYSSLSRYRLSRIHSFPVTAGQTYNVIYKCQVFDDGVSYEFETAMLRIEELKR